MKIHVDDRKTLKDIKEDFAAHFPYLWIEFFHEPHSDHEPSPMEDRIINPELKVGDVRHKDTEGDLAITADMKVQEVEQAFWEKFGLSIQIFRKSLNKWFETTKTDHWTLQEQIDAAREI